MNLLAPAKINLFLSVGARRADGLHDLVSVMQAISLFDTVSLSAAPSLSISVSPAGSAPEDETNLAARAARAMAAGHGRDAGIAIELTKRIPVGAGLAGGSADAAATLIGANVVWDLAVSKKALEKVGAGLGADVAFCVRGGTAVARGAGEDLSSIACPSPVWWVVGISGGSLSTREVYAEYDRLGGGSVGDPYEVADALARADVDRLAPALSNALEPAAFSLMPGLEAGRPALLRGGALAAIVSGSGPTWLGLARDEDHARAIAEHAGAAFARVEVARSIAHGPRS